MTEAYPLQWPEHRPRTNRRERSRFETTQNIAQHALLDEIRRLGGSNAVISTNVELRLDGMPYASRRAPDDPGVAVYFSYKSTPVCFACDRWDLVQDNIQAIRKTIEALRGIARWGTGDMMEAAFRGFEALPAPSERNWREVIVMDGVVPETVGQCTAMYRALSKERHPDHGGNDNLMSELNVAYADAKKELGS